MSLGHDGSAFHTFPHLLFPETFQWSQTWRRVILNSLTPNLNSPWSISGSKISWCIYEKPLIWEEVLEDLKCTKKTPLLAGGRVVFIKELPFISSHYWPAQAGMGHFPLSIKGSCLWSETRMIRQSWRLGHTQRKRSVALWWLALLSLIPKDALHSQPCDPLECTEALRAPGVISPMLSCLYLGNNLWVLDFSVQENLKYHPEGGPLWSHSPLAKDHLSASGQGRSPQIPICYRQLGD